jgi:hypothetical protein
MRESLIQKAILEYIAARHIFAIRVNSGVHFSESKGKRYATRLALPGTADILAFPHKYEYMVDLGPYPLWLEVKSERGKQSELQKSFQAQVEAEGHRYAIVRSIEDIVAALK